MMRTASWRRCCTTWWRTPHTAWRTCGPWAFRPAEPYLSYVARVKENPVARRVKLADLRHNSDLSRIQKVTARDLERVEKYAAAIRLLEG